MTDDRKELEELLTRAAALEAELRALAETHREDTELIGYMEQQLSDRHAADFWRGLAKTKTR
jgi:hypothetical protein